MTRSIVEKRNAFLRNMHLLEEDIKQLQPLLNIDETDNLASIMLEKLRIFEVELEKYGDGYFYHTILGDFFMFYAQTITKE